MGCHYNYDDSEKDFHIINNDNYLILGNSLNNKNKDVLLKSVIEDYKELKKKCKKDKEKYVNLKKVVKSGPKNTGPNIQVQTRNFIDKSKMIYYYTNPNNELSDKAVKIIPEIKNRKSPEQMIKDKNKSNRENNKHKIKKIKFKIRKKIHSYRDNYKHGNEVKKGKIEEIKDGDIGKDKNVAENLQYICDITKDSYSYFYLDNIFTVFNSIDKIFYLIYGTNNKSIIAYNLIENKKVIEIKNAHKQLISSFRYYPDKINKRDLVISLSYDNNIKLWNINNWECLCNFEEINKNGYLLSACFLNDNNQYYIITSNYSDNSELLKIFDLNGNKIKELINSGDDTSFIDTYYDIKLNKNYIVSGNIGYVKSYDYKEEKIYHEYRENDMEDHCSIIINDKEKIVKLIESSGDGHIRIWNFHTAELIHKFTITKKRLFGICLWDEKYLLVGCEDKTIKLIELKTGEVINNLIGYNKIVLSIKKIFHPKYGECLLSQGNFDNQIKLWANKK